MATLEAIQQKIKVLQAKADAVASKETAKVLAQIRDIMDKHGLTISDIEVHLGGKRRGRPPASGRTANIAGKSKGKLPPKYMNPKTGETWSGHARPPRWIASVKDRSKFLIDGNSANTTATVGRKAKAALKGTRGTRGTAAKTKGKLPPKYRDPKTGATWSGHARPPLWIKNVKDRTKFLIAGASATASPNGAGRSKATAQPANKAASKGKLPPKYMNPKTGETWSGQ
jgi:DNA-binding protein H-NS